MFQNKQESASLGIPIWQSKNTQVAQGGFTLSGTAGEYIPAGSPIAFNEATRVATLGKFAVAQAVATDAATTYKVLKNSPLKVGMEIKTSTAAAAQEITAIDTTNAGYDLITTEATLGVAVAVGESIYVNDAGVTPKGLLYEGVTIGSNGIQDVTVVLRGTVYARRIRPIPATVKALLPLIIFSESF